MNETKLCPLTFINPKVDQHCRKEQCAWWSTYAQKCSMESMGDNIFTIESTVNSIESDVSIIKKGVG